MTGLKRATSGHCALVGLDVVLTGLRGTGLCQQLRAKDSDTLILMLTAASGESECMLELGADDCLTKPFRFREFQARVKALSRCKAQAKQTPSK